MEKTANATERKYAEFKHSFTDSWENTEVQLSYRFAKPTKLEVKRMQDTVTKDSTQAARNLLLSTGASRRQGASAGRHGQLPRHRWPASPGR